MSLLKSVSKKQELVNGSGDPNDRSDGLVALLKSVSKKQELINGSVDPNDRSDGLLSDVEYRFLIDKMSNRAENGPLSDSEYLSLLLVMTQPPGNLVVSDAEHTLMFVEQARRSRNLYPRLAEEDKATATEEDNKPLVKPEYLGWTFKSAYTQEQLERNIGTIDDVDVCGSVEYSGYMISKQSDDEYYGWLYHNHTTNKIEAIEDSGDRVKDRRVTICANDEESIDSLIFVLTKMKELL